MGLGIWIADIFYVSYRCVKVVTVRPGLGIKDERENNLWFRSCGRM